jgi:uncharacterized membrane protein SirB2
VTLYVLIKALHVGAALVSVSLFALRFSLTLADRPWRHTALRWLPHVNDTLLLAAAIWLCLLAGWSPLSHHWLTLKILLLLGYIGAGKRALSAKGTRRSQQRAGVLALSLISAIFAAALLKPL